jgi:LysM repeat protein
LLAGHRRAESVLGGAWGDRPLDATALAGGEAGDSSRVDVVRVSGRLGSPLGRRSAVPAIGAAVVVALAVCVGFLSIRGGGPSAGLTSPSTGRTVTASAAAASGAPIAAPSDAATAAPQVTFRAYVVNSGDTWSSIAAKVDLPLAEIRAVNPQLQNVETLEAGTVVYIPPAGLLTAAPIPTFMTYAVRSGDYWDKIASQFNLHSWELQLANPQIKDINHIQVGWILNIPPAGLLTPPPS